MSSVIIDARDGVVAVLKEYRAYEARVGEAVRASVPGADAEFIAQLAKLLMDRDGRLLKADHAAVKAALDELRKVDGDLFEDHNPLGEWVLRVMREAGLAPDEASAAASIDRASASLKRQLIYHAKKRLRAAGKEISPKLPDDGNVASPVARRAARIETERANAAKRLRHVGQVEFRSAAIGDESQLLPMLAKEPQGRTE